MKVRSAIVFLALAAAVSAEELPRKTKAPRESYPNVDVIYGSVTMPDGKRLHSIITKPRAAKEKLPVIFLAGWLSCDSVEAPADTKDATGLILRGLAQTPGFCLFKIDKPGCGDSEGDCSQTDFDTELAGYRAAFRALKNYDFIDSDRVYIFGSSNGGGFAPLVPETESEQAQVRGYITIGGWVKTWFEHMLDIERRRFALMNLAAAWSRVKVPALILHGQYDWIMSREDSELIAQIVNANVPDAARFIEVPEMGHGGQHYLSMADAFAGKEAPFDPKIIRIMTDWLEQRQKKPAK